jgi:hypothetical protein
MTPSEEERNMKGTKTLISEAGEYRMKGKVVPLPNLKSFICPGSGRI